MLRKLKAIEIAEGALLIDIALVFQIIGLLLPTGSSFFYMLACIVFALLTLRRGIYVGIMAMLVALFVSCLLSGPQVFFLVVLEGMGGIFLGATMRWRWHPIPLVILGGLCGALTLYALFFFFVLFFGAPVAATIRSLHTAYNTGISLLGTLAAFCGITVWWRTNLLPLLNTVSMWAFTYWWLMLYIGLCAVFIPFVACLYMAANTVARLLGYEVRPLAGERLQRFQRRIGRRVVRWRLRLERRLETNAHG